MYRINNSILTKVYVTDSIPQGDNMKICNKLEVISISDLLAEAIQRIHDEKSLSALFI